MDDQLVSSASVERVQVGRRLSLPRVQLSERAKERALYGAAAVSYVAIGVFVTEFALSWIVGIAWLMLWVWGLPSLVRRLRR